jgi:radical SAM superfamily enzyme YgiQ (UPF0313 family)
MVPVLLLTKTLHPGTDPVWRKASAPWALGAFCLRSYVESIPELAERVQIEIRSYPSDASDALILDEVRQRRPAIVGFTSQPWNYVDNIRISRTIARLWPNMVVVHGGPMVIARGAYLQKAGPAIKVAVEGEAEETFAELMRHYALGDRGLGAVAGIAYFDDDGALQVNPARAPPDLTKLPPVMTPQNLAEMGSYALYETARGCPFRCSFCNWGSQRTKLRARSRAVIEHDLRAILATPGLEQIWLTDSGLDISKDHVTFVSDTIRRHRQGRVGVAGYVFLLHEDLSYVERIVQGIDQIQVGLQTANEDSLSEIGRKALSVQRFDRILDAVLPHYPSLRVDLLYGLPHIGPADLRDSVRFLLGKGIWLFNLFRLVAIPGTELAENKAKYGLVADEEYPFTVYASDGCTSEDLFEMQQFKVNMDALRFVIADGGYTQALAAGVDLVDFAAQLHLLVPNLNRLVPYDVGFDWAPSAPVVAAMLEAVDRYTSHENGRDALKALIRSRLSPLADDVTAPSGDMTQRFVAAHPALQGNESPAPRQSAQVPGEQVALRVREGGGSWVLRIERATPDRKYFRVIGPHGLYYDSASGAGGDRRAGAVLNLLVQRLLKMAAAGATLDLPEEIATHLRSIRIPGLEIEPVASAAGPAGHGGTATPDARGGRPTAAEGTTRVRPSTSLTAVLTAVEPTTPPLDRVPHRLYLPMADEPERGASRGS